MSRCDFGVVSGVCSPLLSWCCCNFLFYDWRKRVNGFSSTWHRGSFWAVEMLLYMCDGDAHSHAFRHLPPNSATIGYATEWGIYLRACDHRRCQRPPKGLGTNHTPSIAFRHEGCHKSVLGVCLKGTTQQLNMGKSTVLTFQWLHFSLCLYICLKGFTSKIIHSAVYLCKQTVKPTGDLSMRTSKLLLLCIRGRWSH